MKLLISLFLSATLAHAQTTTPAQLQHLRIQAAHAFFLDTPLPPLAPKTFATFDATPNIRIEHVTFATQYGLRVPAIVYVPTHTHGKLPAIVVVCGHGGDNS